jgi:histidyl-tRNA synthetase
MPIIHRLFMLKSNPFYQTDPYSLVTIMKPTIQSVKGTRDFYPEDMAVRAWLYDTVRRVSESFGYQEYDAPFMEPIELYAAKSGEELVKEQSFVFPDRGGDLVTLRPELTPSLARLVAQRQRQLVYPLRWWSWGPFWRYEKPQKGRAREFFQWNIDLIGPDTPEADAELVAIAVTFFKEVGVTPQQVNILVNDRRLMNIQLDQLDVQPELRPNVLRLIDRRQKLSLSDWDAYAREIGLSTQQIDGLNSRLIDNELWRQSPELQRFFAAIQALGVSEYVRYAPHIIRGLLYYTGTVFEAWDVAGEFRSLFGGGRYDNLVSDVGGEPLAAVGFAMGDMVIRLILEKFGCLPKNLSASPAQVLVTVFDESFFPAAMALAAQLRQAGLKVACFPEPIKLARQIKYADRMGIRLALILGPDEQAAGTVNIKDLNAQIQETVLQSNAVAVIVKMLESHPAS